MSWGISIIDKISNNDFESCKLTDKPKVKEEKCIFIINKNNEYVEDSNIFIKNVRFNRKTRWNNYKKEVKTLSELNSKELLNGKTRGFKENHIDHIVPISYGFKKSIPVSLISSKDNLQVLSYKDNMKKGVKITKEAIELLIKWGYEIPKHP